MLESLVDNLVGQIVGVVISVVIGIWVLSLFGVDVVGFVKGLFGKERVVVKCSSCGKKNSEKANYCTKCGRKLRKEQV